MVTRKMLQNIFYCRQTNTQTNKQTQEQKEIFTVFQNVSYLANLKIVLKALDPN
jgi:hypothetical protein